MDVLYRSKGRSMGLNIKNERVHALAREAARVTGKNQTSAIEEALELLLRAYGADPHEAGVARKVDLVTRLHETGRPVVVISFGTPYLLNQIPFAKAYAVAWGGTGSSQRAAARALLGERPITGKLPTSIPPYVSIGTGEVR